MKDHIVLLLRACAAHGDHYAGAADAFEVQLSAADLLRLQDLSRQIARQKAEDPALFDVRYVWPFALVDSGDDDLEDEPKLLPAPLPEPADDDNGDATADQPRWRRAVRMGLPILRLDGKDIEFTAYDDGYEMDFLSDPLPLATLARLFEDGAEASP